MSIGNLPCQSTYLGHDGYPFWYQCHGVGLQVIEITSNPIHSKNGVPYFSLDYATWWWIKDYQPGTTCQNTLGSIGWAYCLCHLVHRRLGTWNLWVLHPLHLTYHWVLLDWVFLEPEGGWTWPRGKNGWRDSGEGTHPAVDFHPLPCHIYRSF